MVFEKNVPDWDAPGVEPSDELKKTGFTAGYKPPAAFFNWFWHGVSACLTEIRDKFTAHATDTNNPHGVTAEQAGAASTDLKNVSAEDFKNKVSDSGIVCGIPTVNAESADGVAYTATLENVTELVEGLTFNMIPNMTTTTTAPTMNVNGLGAVAIRRRLSIGTASTSAGEVTTMFYVGRPVQLMYNGTHWIATEFTKPCASDLYGNVAIENGGTGASTFDAALLNLGIQSGKKNGTSNTAANETKDINVTFPTAYAEGTTPMVVVGFGTQSTAYGMGRCSVTVIETTNTGFTMRLYNADSNARNPDYYWIAFGTPAQ